MNNQLNTRIGADRTDMSTTDADKQITDRWAAAADPEKMSFHRKNKEKLQAEYYQQLNVLQTNVTAQLLALRNVEKATL